MTGPHLTAFYLVVGAYLLLVCGIGLANYRRASTEEDDAVYHPILPLLIDSDCARISVPEANPSLSLAASLGITFPFNVIAGIPLYYTAAERARSMLVE